MFYLWQSHFMEKIGSLNALTKSNPNAKKAFVILHGYGADASDLYPLSNVIDTDADFIFLEAPLNLNLGGGFMGKAWFNIDQAELMQSERKDFSYKTSEEMHESTDKVINSLVEISKNYDEIYLGGFSQGAMISANAFITSFAKGIKLPITKLVLMSGARINLEFWKTHLTVCPQINLFSSHGTQDAVLPFKFGEGLFSFLSSHLKGKFMSFEDGHTIPNKALSELNKWIKTK